MNLENLAEAFAQALGFDDVYAANIDGGLDRCIGVYGGRKSGAQNICIGGKSCTKTHEKQISVLVHWTDNPTLAEVEAERIASVLSDMRNEPTNSCIVRYIALKDPVPVGRNERGICEYVIEGTVYYEESED